MKTNNNNETIILEQEKISTGKMNDSKMRSEKNSNSSPNKGRKSKNTYEKQKQLILKSGLKNSLKNVFQLIGLAILIGTTFLLSMSIVVTNSRINKNYKNIITTSVQHDFIVDITNSPRISFKEDQWIGGENIDLFNNQDLNEQYLINVLSRKGVNNVNGQVTGENFFDWSRTETRNFYGLQNNKTNLNVKVITKSSLIDEKRDNAKSGILPVDKLILDNGKTDNIFSQNKKHAAREIVLQSNFAHKNNIEIGDIIRVMPDNFGHQLLVKKDVSNIKFGGQVSINDVNNGIENSNYKDQNWFQVIGFGTSADFIYPAIGEENIIPSNKSDFLAYVDPIVFGLLEQTIKTEVGNQLILYSYELAASKLSVQSENDREIYFSGKFLTPILNSEIYLNSFNNEWINFGNIGSNKIKLFYKLNDPGYKWSIRTSAYSKVILSYWLISTFILVLITIICIFSISLIVKKQFDDAKRKLGTFKALGYSNRELLNYFIPTPLIIGIIGVILGYSSTLAGQNFLTNVFLNYFSLQNTNLSLFVWQAIVLCILTIGLLVSVTLAIGYLVMDKSALTLLSGNIAKKSTKVGMGIKFLFRKSRPSIKLHVALTIGSFSKIIGTSFTLLISAFLITLSLITPEIVKKNNTATFTGLNYAGTIEYTTPVSNNPATFFKTYNQNKMDEWNYENNKIVAEIDDSSNALKNFLTAYPVKKSNSDNYQYDTTKILQDLFTGDISKNYYSYNIPLTQEGDYSSFYEYAKINYSNWKNLSLDFLKQLDNLDTNIDFTNPEIPYFALTSLTKQWTDYKFLIDEIETTAIELNSTLISESAYISNLKKIALSLQNFYKKYHNGIPIQINKAYLIGNQLNTQAVQQIDFDSHLIENPTNDIYGDNNVRSPIKLATKGIYPLFYGYDSSSDANNETWNNLVYQFAKELDTNENSLKFLNDNIETININTTELSKTELLQFNSYLINWYWINFEGKIGTMLLESNYQNSNNVVQNSIISSVKNNSDYNITSNIIPFDKQQEELGTIVSGIYTTPNNSQNINLYGLNPNTQAVDLKDNQGVDLLPNLFRNLNSEYQDYVPIVINQTVARKLNIGFKDTLDIDIVKKVLLDNNNKVIDLKDVEMGIKAPYLYGMQTSNEIISESKKNYYAYNSDNKGWTSTSDIQTAKINGFNIASTSINDISKETEILSAVNNSKIKKENILQNKKFFVVGVTNNYGESKAWISNQNANKILGYNDVQKYFFNNFFINEWRGSNALKNFYDSSIFQNVTKKQWQDFLQAYETTKLLEWDKGIYSSGTDNPYDDFVETFLKVNEGSGFTKYKDAAIYVHQMFENLYPIFNYKILLNNETDDQVTTSAKTQAYGDYSPVGMMGSSTIVNDPKSNTSTIFYTEGYEESVTATSNLMSNKQKTLKSIEDLTTLLIYIIMIVALLISIIIIVITTSLIIEENSQFIATMKILGYSNLYVMLQVSGIYILPILITFTGGFIMGYYLVSFIVNYISLNYAFVIPFNFGIIIPFMVLGILLLIYISTISITFNRFTKIKPTDSLQISN